MTREEALEQIRKWDFLNEEEKEAIQTLVPVLAESEDERIRKDIIALIEFGLTEGSAVSPGSRTTKEEALTWLEKQKEPENVSASTMIPSCWEVEQKEQKPDSLIYDKDLDKAAREFYLSGGADSPFDSTGLVPIVRMAEFGATWMKERMEKEQKPTWSEEDDMLMDELESYILYDKEFNDEQKSWRIKRLKSLRPSWKPSEEQMSMLLAVVNDPNNAGSESCHLSLESLYNDLKKL